MRHHPQNIPALPHPVLSNGGEATHVLVPIREYLAIFGKPDEPPVGYVFVPIDVSRKVTEGKSPLRAWREHFGLSQSDMAGRMDVTRPAYTQMEKAGNKPHRGTLERAATAFGIDLAQLAELYDDEPVSVPDDLDDARYPRGQDELD